MASDHFEHRPVMLDDVFGEGVDSEEDPAAGQSRWHQCTAEAVEVHDVHARAALTLVAVGPEPSEDFHPFPLETEDAPVGVDFLLESGQ